MISVSKHNSFAPKKPEADDFKKVDIWWLLRDMHQRTYKSSTISFGKDACRGKVGCEIFLTAKPYARFHYTQTGGEQKLFDYEIPLVQSPCHLGGYRYWFLCPMRSNGKYCGRRVGTLYLDDGYFACRHCHNLTYRSRKINYRSRSDAMFRFLDKDLKVRELEGRIKRKVYAGKLTKKQARLWQLQGQMLSVGRQHLGQYVH